MMYILALLLPPLALLLSGKPFQALFSAVFWVLAWILAIFGAGFIVWVILAAHAILVVRDRNTRKMMEDIARQNRD
ncbi:MAG: YqaE/Pmp3 family membrane protein [Kordiimonas sp.]